MIGIRDPDRTEVGTKQKIRNKLVTSEHTPWYICRNCGRSNNLDQNVLNISYVISMYTLHEPYIAGFHFDTAFCRQTMDTGAQLLFGADIYVQETGNFRVFQMGILIFKNLNGCSDLMHLI